MTDARDGDALLAAAQEIAREVVDAASWHGERCNWVGATPEERPGGQVAMTYKALVADLYGGSAGVGLFLAEPASATGDPDSRRTALGACGRAVRHAISRVGDIPPQLGLYAGRLGVLLALTRAARELCERELETAARHDRRRRRPRGAGPRVRPDDRRRQLHRRAAGATATPRTRRSPTSARSTTRSPATGPTCAAACRDEADAAIATTQTWVAAADASGAADYSLCHGLGGNAEILVDAGKPTLADRAAAAGIERYLAQKLPWPCGANGGATPCLFLGLAGIGRFYLRLVQPDLPSLLLIRPTA